MGWHTWAVYARVCPEGAESVRRQSLELGAYTAMCLSAARCQPAGLSVSTETKTTTPPTWAASPRGSMWIGRPPSSSARALRRRAQPHTPLRVAISRAHECVNPASMRTQALLALMRSSNGYVAEIIWQNWNEQRRLGLPLHKEETYKHTRTRTWLKPPRTARTRLRVPTPGGGCIKEVVLPAPAESLARVVTV